MHGSDRIRELMEKVVVKNKEKIEAFKDGFAAETVFLAAIVGCAIAQAYLEAKDGNYGPLEKLAGVGTKGDKLWTALD